MSRAVNAVVKHVAIIVIFSMPSVAVFWHAWGGHLGSTLTCACSDAGQQVWFTAWPAYALSHGVNPFFSGLVWAPNGANLLINASSPLIGVILAPVTWAWGPVVSTNLALTLAPGLSAWACWLACRRFVSLKWTAWVGGLIFGYSPFVFSSIRQGHLGLALLVTPPLVLLLLDEILHKQKARPVLSGVGLGFLVVAQFFISPEVLVMTVTVAVVGVLVVAILAGKTWYKQKALYAATSFGTAFVVVGVTLTLPAWFALDGPRHITGAVWPNINLFGNKVNDLWDPDSLASAGAAFFGPIGHSVAALGFTGPNPAYVGFGAIALAVFSVVVAWRRKATWALLSAAIASFVLSLGSAGLRHDSLSSLKWLPWQSLVKWPLLDDVLPSRFALLTDLAISVLVSIGIDQLCVRLRPVHGASQGSTTARHHVVRHGGRLRKNLVPALSICVVAGLALVPMWRSYSVPTATETVQLPTWFAKDEPGVPTGSVVLSYPFPSSASLASEPMIWQAEDRMHFALAGGYLKVPGPDGHPLTAGAPGSATNSLDMITLVRQTSQSSWAPTAGDLAALRSAVSSWRVSYIVVTTTGLNPVYSSALMTAVTGRLPVVADRAWVWNLRGTPLSDSFDSQAASSAFATCRSGTALFQSPLAGKPLPQRADVCVLRALGS